MLAQLALGGDVTRTGCYGQRLLDDLLYQGVVRGAAGGASALAKIRPFGTRRAEELLRGRGAGRPHESRLSRYEVSADYGLPWPRTSVSVTAKAVSRRGGGGNGDRTDVLVAGADPSGIMAALSPAREARRQLIEKRDPRRHNTATCRDR